MALVYKTADYLQCVHIVSTTWRLSIILVCTPPPSSQHLLIYLAIILIFTDVNCQYYRETIPLTYLLSH